jgi:hypothetical protein
VRPEVLSRSTFQMKSSELARSLDYTIRSAMCHPPLLPLPCTKHRGWLQTFLCFAASLTTNWSAQTAFNCLVWGSHLVAVGGQRAANSPWILQRHLLCQDDSILALDTMHVLGGHQRFGGTCTAIFAVQVIESRRAQST